MSPWSWRPSEVVRLRDLLHHRDGDAAGVGVQAGCRLVRRGAGLAGVHARSRASAGARGPLPPGKSEDSRGRASTFAPASKRMRSRSTSAVGSRVDAPVTTRRSSCTGAVRRRVRRTGSSRVRTATWPAAALHCSSFDPLCLSETGFTKHRTRVEQAVVKAPLHSTVCGRLRECKLFLRVLVLLSDSLRRFSATAERFSQAPQGLVLNAGQPPGWPRTASCTVGHGRHPRGPERNRDRGEPRGSAPPTPPCVRVRTRRFDGVKRHGLRRRMRGRFGRRKRWAARCRAPG